MAIHSIAKHNMAKYKDKYKAKYKIGTIKINALISLCLLFGGLSMASSAGEYYKWVDENGVSHFSERPPQSKTEAVKVKVKTKSAAQAPQTQGEQEPSQLSSQTPAANNNSNNNSNNNTKIDTTRCEAEKMRLKSLSSGARIRMQDDQGGFYYLEQQDIANEIKKSRQAIRESCA